MRAEWLRPLHGLLPRWLSVCLLLAVFFLPLHVHTGSAIASQVSKECVCLHGSRLQAGFTAMPVASATLIVIGEVAPPVQTVPVSLSIHNPSSRAPPQQISR